MKNKSLITQIRDAGHFDSVGKSSDPDLGQIITIRRGYFYRHGLTAQKFAEYVEKMLSKAGLLGEGYGKMMILDCGDHWAPFNGGASIARSSHMWVKLQVNG